MDKVLIIIPIKHNSKRLIGKNFQIIDRRCLFEYAIDAAVKADISNKSILYSSERKCNGALPIPDEVKWSKRPSILTEDPNEIGDVCLYELKNQKEKFDTLIMIQPSNPFVEPEDVENCYKLFLRRGDRRQVRSVTALGKRIWLKYKKFDIMTPLNTAADIYIGNGSIVIVDCNKFLEYGVKYFNYGYMNDGFGEHVMAYEMVKERSIDINDEYDLEIVRHLKWREKYYKINTMEGG